MSTRANIVFTDSYSELYFYRHSDGYPEYTFEDLKEFVKGYEGKMRNNCNQSAGWLIMRGNAEYWSKPENMKYMEWKVGSYEPTNELHGDIEYLYWINLEQGFLNCYEYTGGEFKDYTTKDPLKSIDFKINKGL